MVLQVDVGLACLSRLLLLLQEQGLGEMACWQQFLQAASEACAGRAEQAADSMLGLIFDERDVKQMLGRAGGHPDSEKKEKQGQQKPAAKTVASGFSSATASPERTAVFIGGKVSSLSSVPQPESSVTSTTNTAALIRSPCCSCMLSDSEGEALGFLLLSTETPAGGCWGAPFAS
jgi:hypothetical protein